MQKRTLIFGGQHFPSARRKHDFSGTIFRARTLILRLSSYQIPSEQLLQVTLLTGGRVLNVLLLERSLGEILLWLPLIRFPAGCVQDLSSKLCIELVRLVYL